jgi:hypothetical protein
MQCPETLCGRIIHSTACEKHARFWSDNLKGLHHYRDMGTDGTIIDAEEMKLQI